MRADCIGEVVPEAFDGKARGVFARACYAFDANGRGIVLLAEGTPMAPHGIRLPVPRGWLAEAAGDATSVRIADGRLLIGDRRACELPGANRYSDLLQGAAQSALPSPAFSAIERAVARARLPRTDGFARQARERALALLSELEASCQQGDEASARAATRSMAGLGPGLTPSGDDLLVGFACGLHAVGAVPRWLRGALSDSAERTSEVSRGFVSLAAEGRFVEPIRAVATALIAEEPDAAAAAARVAIAQGVTSGMDGVLGLLAGARSGVAARTVSEVGV